MAVNWNILYRGSLDSCNYDCHYCPFAKKKNTREELAADKKELIQFSNWVAKRKENLNILITPWGEGLIRTYYQEVMHKLSHLNQVNKIVIQTNISCSTKWMKNVNKNSFALWVTYHPEQVKYSSFQSKIKELQQLNIQFSLGIVGKKEHFKHIEILKNDFPNQYVWVNAYKDEPDYYQQEEIDWLSNIDTQFHSNLTNYQSKGKACKAGESSFSIKHNGDVFPCHFIEKKIGNIYKDDLAKLSKKRLCSVNECSCYIGYINLKNQNFDAVYGNKILERIPIN